MMSRNFDSDEYYADPGKFIERRKQIEPAEQVRFNVLLGGISRVVLSYPEYYFQTESGATKTYLGEGSKALMGDKDVIEEIDGPMRSADNRAMDLRLLTTEHSLRKSLGFVAFVGFDWKSTPHLSDVATPGELTSGLLSGGIHIQGDFGAIDTLWVLSSDNRNHWITTYADARPITDFEYDQLVEGLMAYPSV